MKEKIYFGDGYYYGDTTTSYVNGQFTKLMHGYGTYYWNDGSTFTGTVQNNNFLNGTHVLKGQWTYEGPFVNMCYDGYGKITYQNGDCYVGQFSKGAANGRGRITFACGGYYDGELVNNLRHGKGENVYSDGAKYVGDYVNGRRTGFGKQTNSNGDVYEGYWVDDLFSGKGKYVFASGGYCDGDWLNNSLNGKAEFVYSDGSKYIGDYVNGKRRGRGRYWGKESSGDFYYDGEWFDDVIEGEGTFIGDGFRYDGGFRNGLYGGKGTLYFHEDAYSDEYPLEDLIELDYADSYSYRYVGDFKDGDFHGMGTITMSDSILQASFVKGIPDGSAVLMVNADGFRLPGVKPAFNTYTGMIMDGDFVGIVKLTDGKTGEERTVPVKEANEPLSDILEYVEDYRP